MALHAARAIRQRHKLLLDEDETLSTEQIKVLEEAFEAADKNGDGILSADEYAAIFRSHGLVIDREWIDKLIAQNDKDGDGGISFPEFLEMNQRFKSQKTSHSTSNSSTSTNGSSLNLSSLNQSSTSVEERARIAFNAYDRNREGFLTKAKFKKTSKNMTDAQIDAVFEKYDRNGDGRLSFEEFKCLMLSNQRQQNNGT
uniref:Calmodulin-related protein n=1 Tax=Caligus clemensi TaxID=344056 RepID=C1C337_CALCM|nr:Calmodulin-related protein [Caligus clemensi]